MKIAGSQETAVDRVWEALQDPAVLTRTLPGCEQLEVTGPGRYAATLTAGGTRVSYEADAVIGGVLVGRRLPRDGA